MTISFLIPQTMLQAIALFKTVINLHVIIQFQFQVKIIGYSFMGFFL